MTRPRNPTAWSGGWLSSWCMATCLGPAFIGVAARDDEKCRQAEHATE